MTTSVRFFLGCTDLPLDTRSTGFSHVAAYVTLD